VKAFLLAAGEGTRLRPLTDSVPKCLVPIAGVPLLGIWLNWCCRYGIDDVLINTHAHASAVHEYVAANKPHGLRITVTHEPELLGSAGTVRHNRAFVADDQRFAILYADVLTNADFAGMAAFHNSHGGVATLGVYQVSEPSRCGIVNTDANALITKFVEKPRRPPTNLAFSGLMIASPAVLDEIPPKLPADLGFDLFPRLVSRMYAFPITDYLMDIGTMERYEAAQAEWTYSACRDQGIAC
jgi:mannose-1-phosphate guanylyltransferase